VVLISDFFLVLLWRLKKCSYWQERGVPPAVGPYGPMDQAPAYGTGDSGFGFRQGLFFALPNLRVFILAEVPLRPLFFVVVHDCLHCRAV
jgi:hypothetical protein